MRLMRIRFHTGFFLFYAVALTPPAAAGSAGLIASEHDPGPTSTTATSTSPSDNVLAPAPSQSSANPVVGNVEGHLIYLSELGEASKTVPENLRGLPFQTLYPVLLDRMIDHQSLVIMARRKGLEEEKQPEIQAAVDHILEAAYLGKVAAPLVTEQAIQARYDRRYANRPATEEVRARHILVMTEVEARKALTDLQKGADFATIARAISRDADGAKGGDLGFFRADQVWPGFAEVAFSLQPGQVAPNPVRNEFGWHVIKVEARRLVPPPTLASVHDELRQELLAAAVQDAIAIARSQLRITRFNMDGSEIEGSPRLSVSGTDSPPGMPPAQ